MIAPSVEAIKAEIIYHARACEKAMQVADHLQSVLEDREDAIKYGARSVAMAHSSDAFHLAYRLQLLSMRHAKMGARSADREGQ